MLDEMGENLALPEIPGSPFLVDIVIVRFVARAEVSTLKKLRKMDIKWNYFGTNMMEKMASKGQLKVGLSGESNQERIDDFLDSTMSNLKLFRSFRINFEYLKGYFRHISKYSPKFLQLDIKNHPIITVDDKKTLHLFLALIAPEIQELEIHVHDPPNSQWNHSLKGHYEIPVLPKLKRFACIGFEGECSRRWYDTTAMLSLFDFLLAKGGRVDYTPNLTALEMKINIYEMGPYFGTGQLTPVVISRWARLTHIIIHRRIGQNIALANFLQSLGQAGMRLESLELILESIHIINEWPAISRNLSEFFQTQAKSLKILDFTCICLYPEINTKIQFPVFEVVHTLKLKGKYLLRFGQVDKRMFDMGPLPVNFSKLDHLEVNCEFFTSLFSNGVPTEPMRLQTLTIYRQNHKYDRISVREAFIFWKNIFELIRNKFESVVHFRCDGSLLQGRAPKKSCVQSLRKFLGMSLINVDERKLPWKKSLKILEINGVKCPLKLSHLKGLEKLIVIEENAPEYPNEYLSRFKNVRRLKLLEISFQFKKSISNRDMKKFAHFFPFPVIFGTK